MVRRKISHYKIREKLAEGRMSVASPATAMRLSVCVLALLGVACGAKREDSASPLVETIKERVANSGQRSVPTAEISRPEPGQVRENPKDGLRYAWIPPGKFTMGCSQGDNECQADEKPAHEVEISRGFWMGQTEVTIAAYERFRQATGKPALPTKYRSWRKLNTEGENPDLPAVLVIWDEAKDYCEWAGLRLPTEAEWEYAARAEARGARYGQLETVAWYKNNSGDKPLDTTQFSANDRDNIGKKLYENGNGPKSVGGKLPNAWTLYDMLGNAWEWVSDPYDENYYQQQVGRDPPGPLTGKNRVLRGAGWSHSPRAVRVSNRSAGDPTEPFYLNYALPVHLVRAEPPGTIWGPPKTWGKKVGWQRFQLRQSTPRRSPKWLPNENSIAPEGPSNKAPARGPRGPIKSGLPRPITSVARI